MSDVDKIIGSLIPRYNKDGTGKSPYEFKIIYDSSTETLEPIYFWVLDFMNNMFSGKVEKLVDNFASSPGSGHFSELQGKASQMQQESSRVLGTVNNILKGVINLLYDLREFKIRLSHYETANSKDKDKRQSGMLALKQIWMDRVDIQRGQGSLNALSSGNLQFVTLRDAFMAVDSIEDINKLDLNDRVKRVLIPRMQEFLEWKNRSYEELKKRFEIERIYLKSQVDALKLNARWAKPYLKAAEMLRQNDDLGKNPGMVTAFNTIMFQLEIMGTRGVNIRDAVFDKLLPPEFVNMKNLRKYYAVCFVDFFFRGIPSKQGQTYTFGGRAEVTFKSYAMNDDELKLLKEKLSDTDLTDSLKLVQGMTDESLGQLNADIDEFMPDDKKKKDEKKSDPEDTNPFSALFNIMKIKDSKDKVKDKEKERFENIKKEFKKSGKLRKDNYAEEYLRNYAEADAMNSCFGIYDKYKKAHGMATFPYGGDENEPDLPQSDAEKFFGFK